MDNFDEFEFKPITEGLGFHKKTQRPKLDLGETLQGKTLPKAPAREGIGRASQFTKLGEEKIELYPQASSPQTNTQISPSQKVRGPSYQLNKTTFAEEEKVAPRSNFSKTAISVAIPSIFFDAIVVIGLTGLFLFATFLIAKVDPVTVVKMIPQEPMTTIGLVLLVFSVLQGYLLISRCFFSSTLGEWAFEIEVGTTAQQNLISYPFRVLLRSLITLATGIILLPLMSLIIGRDIAGRISGVSLYRG